MYYRKRLISKELEKSFLVVLLSSQRSEKRINSGKNELYGKKNAFKESIEFKVDEKSIKKFLSTH